MVIEVYIDGWIDITDKVLKSYSQKDLLSVEVAKTSTLSIKLSGDRAFFELLSQDHEIKVTDQDRVKFWGFSDGSISVDYEREDIAEGSLKYYDFVKKLSGTTDDLSYTNIQIAGTEGALLETLFAKLVSLSGVDLTLNNDYIDVSEIDEIYIPSDDILTIFYDFLYYNGLSFYLIGKDLYIYDMLSIPSGQYVLDDVADLKENFNYGKTSWNPLVYASKIVSSEKRVFTLSDEAMGELLIDGDSYPIVEDDEPEVLTCGYDIELDDNEEQINVQDVTVTQVVFDNTGESVELDSYIEVGQDSADIKLTNNTGNYVLLDNLYLDALIKIQQYYLSLSISEDTDDEIKTIFLRDASHVNRFLRYVVFLNGYDIKDYTFYSDADMNLGDMVSINGMTEPLIITQKIDKQDDFGGYDYTAVLYQNATVDPITKLIAVSKYAKDYITDIYSAQGFIFDGDFSTTLKSKTYLGTSQVIPRTFRWYRDIGLDGDTWTKDTQDIEITQEDLGGKASGLFWLDTTYPTTRSLVKKVVNMAKNTSQFLIEYCVSDNADIPSMVYLGQFGTELYEFSDELIEIFEGAVWTTEQPQDDDKYIFIRITDGDSQTISLYATPKEKSITLYADNSGIFSVDQRGVVRNDTIVISLRGTNFTPVDGNVTWYMYSTDWIQLVGTDTELVINHDDYSYPLNIKATYDIGDGLESTIEITEIVLTNPTLHFGVLEITPLDMLSVPVGFDEEGQEFVKGDSYVYYDGTDYVPYAFNGTSWVEIADAEGNVDTKYADIMIQSANSVTSIDRDIPETSVAVYGYFRNLSAINAFIDNLTTNNLLLNNGGSLRSDYYNEDGSINAESIYKAGIYINSDGVVKLTDADVSGAFRSDAFSTQDEAIGDTYSAQAPVNTLWSESDFYDAFPATEGQSLTACTGSWTIGGFSKSLIGITKMKTSERVLFEEMAGLPISTTVRTEDEGSAKLLTNFYVPTDLAEDMTIRMKISIDGFLRYMKVVVYDENGDYYGDVTHGTGTWYLELPISKGYHIYIYGWTNYNNLGGFLTWDKTLKLHYVNYYSPNNYVGCIGVDSDYNVYELTGFSSAKYHEDVHSLTSPSFSTSSVVSRKSGTDVVDEFEGSPLSFVSASGNVTVESFSNPIDSFKKVGDSVTFKSGNDETTVNRFVDGSSVGVYSSLSMGNIISISQSGAIRTKNVVPKGDSQYDIGQLGDGTVVDSWDTLQSVASIGDRVRGTSGSIYECKATTLTIEGDSYNNISLEASPINGEYWESFWQLDDDQSGTKIQYRNGYFSGRVNSTEVENEYIVLNEDVPQKLKIINAQAGAERIVYSGGVETNSTSFVKVFEYDSIASGTVNTYLSLRTTNPNYDASARIYINGVAVGTLRTTNSTSNSYFSENIAVNYGDKIQIYAKNEISSYITACILEIRTLYGLQFYE